MMGPVASKKPEHCQLSGVRAKSPKIKTWKHREIREKEPGEGKSKDTSDWEQGSTESFGAG